MPEIILLFLIVILVGILLWNRSCILSTEGFDNTSHTMNHTQDMSEPLMGDAMADAHGSTPPGLGALEGKLLHEGNTHAPYVNAVPSGNSQNTNPMFKRQPPGSSQ